MAIYYWNIISLKKGAATPYAGYISRQGGFSERRDLVASGHGNLPPWCNGDPAVFWPAADLHERSNGSVCREIVAALPRELSLSEWVTLVHELIKRDIGPKPYQYAIHVPNDRSADESHPHVHILYCDRIPDDIERSPDQFFRRFNAQAPQSGGCRKGSGGRTPLQLRIELDQRRSQWADILNGALAAGGHPGRVSHRANELAQV